MDDVTSHDVAKKLRDGYSPTMQAVELTAVLVYFGCQALLLYRLWGDIELSFWGWVAVGLGSCLLADFISGLFHWAGDTWGSPDMPVLGKLFVRTFREHHVDERAITRHGFIETTGGNCAICLPWFAVHLVPLEDASNGARVGAAFLGLFLFFIFLTSLTHRWAHMAQPPALVRRLQSLGILLSPEHHSVHHVPPHIAHYCITGGWLNRPLDRIGFFRGAEVVVNLVTGLVPRADDAATITATIGATPPKPSEDPRP